MQAGQSPGSPLVRGQEDQEEPAKEDRKEQSVRRKTRVCMFWKPNEDSILRNMEPVTTSNAFDTSSKMRTVG